MEWHLFSYFWSECWCRPRVRPLSFSIYFRKMSKKISTFPFLSFSLWMMVLLFLRINWLTFQTLIFSVVIMYWPNFLMSLVLSLNIQKLKYFTLTDRMGFSTLLHLISLPLEVLLFILKTHRSTWDSFSIESSLSINTSIIIQTKLFQCSNA